ncbi:hypothetical protein C1H46_007353 [Malus baccata]|uniref:beta-galactosidase n=1 Tax=Malus baccata TaxID=106549 RepID=A0A540N8S0_MALBA|nr:hypothetical protein C1H46_007353 [Malus baccata]
MYGVLGALSWTWLRQKPPWSQYKGSNFKGRYNLVRFLKTMQKAGLYAHLHIGPYVCVECNFGGLLQKHVMETPLLSLSLEVFDGRLDDPISVSIRGGQSPSGKFLHPSGVEHYLSDSINALRNCYGEKQLFTPL